MAQQQRQAFCPVCKQSRLHTRNTYDVPHILHLLLSLVTGGLWLPIWFLHAMLNGRSTVPFLCTVCGTAEKTVVGRAVEYASRATGQLFQQPQRSPPRLRMWTDVTGRFREEAAFVNLANGQVRLRKADGKELVIPLPRLCSADIEWCRDLERLR